MELSGGTSRLPVDEVLANGAIVVALCTAFWEYASTRQAEDEFWSRLYAP